jgi:hypothetical protein
MDVGVCSVSFVYSGGSEGNERGAKGEKRIPFQFVYVS